MAKPLWSRAHGGRVLHAWDRISEDGRQRLKARCNPGLTYTTRRQACYDHCSACLKLVRERSKDEG